MSALGMANKHWKLDTHTNSTSQTRFSRREASGRSRDSESTLYCCGSRSKACTTSTDTRPRQNDILSYCKEEVGSHYSHYRSATGNTVNPAQKEGVTHNMVAICRHAGMPAQMAFDHIGEMLVSCYRDWYMALAELPSWGERIDAEVQQYIRGVQNVVMANLNWRYGD